jgi:hypothetical protein
MELLAISGRELEGSPQGYGPGGFIGVSIKLESPRQLDIPDPMTGLIDVEALLPVLLILVKQTVLGGLIPASRWKTEGTVIPIDKPIHNAAPLDYVRNRQPDFEILGDPIAGIQAESGAFPIQHKAFVWGLIVYKIIRQVNDQPEIGFLAGEYGGFTDGRQTENLNQGALILSVERAQFNRVKVRGKKENSPAYGRPNTKSNTLMHDFSPSIEEIFGKILSTPKFLVQGNDRRF